MKPLVARTIEIAESHIGKREIGRTNRGKDVDRWLRTSGVSPGNPWCAGFTYTNKEDAADELGVENPFIRTAYTPDIFNFARERDILVPNISKGKINLPEPGDDFLVMGPVRIFHTGHVQDVTPKGFWKIEGNSNDEGSREGYEVARNFTEFKSKYYFVRWSRLLPDVIGKPHTRALYLGGKQVDDVPVRGNITLVDVRKWAHWTRQPIHWRGGSEAPILLKGKPFEAELTFIKNEKGENKAHAAVRDLVALDETLAVDKFDPKTQSVYVVRVKK